MTRAVVSALLVVLWVAACVPDVGRPELLDDTYRLILEAEDARPSEGPGLATLLDATALDDPFLRRTAVRALGRLEAPDLAPVIEHHLSDPDAGVREAAAEALAQAVHGQDADAVVDALLARVTEEPDAAVRGTLARSLGRLSLDPQRRSDVEQALVELGGAGGDAPLETLVGVALGFESLVRRSGDQGVSSPAADLLLSMMRLRRDGGSRADMESAGHVRALAAVALGGSRRMSLGLIREALDDPEPEVRRVVLAFLRAAPPSARDGLLRQALTDTSVRVATEAILRLAASSRTDASCEHLVSVAGADSPASIRVAALTALARPCPSPGVQRETLLQAVDELGEVDVPWQPAAQGLVSLAALDPERAARLLPAFVEHESPFVRTHAARVAATTRTAEALFRLSVDPSPNVRAEAARGLFAMDGHGMDSFLVEQLEGDDPQLLMTVAELLEGAPDRPRTSQALLATFERISAAQRETWRDPRLALLARIAELGDASMAERLSPFLADYDPVVAATIGSTLESWTGREQLVEPSPLPRVPVPGMTQLRALEALSLLLHMGGGGTLEIELLAEQAPTNVARLVRLTRDGYFDGLTFHRWAPNFVIQGGSPGANEYQGDGPYTRDEVGGIPHWRGTVGLSTRGRDTGDGQLFINLVDNVRLDYDYTVMGRLADGYDVLDGILEGAVIERAEVVTSR